MRIGIGATLLAMGALAASGCAAPAGVGALGTAAMMDSPATSEEAGGATAAPDASGWRGEKLDRWQFSATPFLWAAGLDSTVKIDGRSTSSSASFNEILPNLDLAVMAHFEAKKGPWAIFAEGIWMDLSTEGTLPILGETTVSLSEFIGEGAVAYRFFQGPVHTQGGPGFQENLSLEAYAGARYTRIHGKFNPEAFGSASDSMDWTDPLVGLRARLDVSPRYALIARGDAGGFRGNSDNSWFFMAGAEWRPSTAISVEIGYAVLTQKYRNGDDSGDFYLRQKMSGPIAGITFRF